VHGIHIQELREGQRRRDYHDEQARVHSNNLEEMMTMMFNFQFPASPRVYNPWGLYQPPPSPEPLVLVTSFSSFEL